MKLLEKVAIITGGTSGIGLAIAQLFSKEGANVVLVGRDEKKGNRALNNTLGNVHKAVFIKTDVSNSEAVSNMVDKTIQNYGKIDILINNAGINILGTVVDTTEKIWDEIIDINLKGVFLCCKYTIPYMLKAGKGSIINLGSINSFMAFENEVAYDASKGGVLMFTKATALDYAKNNIRVNCICPGAIKTPQLQAVINESSDPEELEDGMIKKHPVNRLGRPDEVARLALFLASDDSSFITGAAITVDGGILAGWPT